MESKEWYFQIQCEESVSEFQVYMARWDNSPKPNVTIRYSTNSGSSYSNIITIDGDYFTGDKIYKLYTHTFGATISPDNAGDKIYIEFVTNSGERMLYDDFEITYGGSSTAPDNPSSFVATAIPSQEIILTWFQNTDNDDVMVAYSLNGTFGVPLNGTGYNTSDLISGGGEVIYNGPLSTFIHTNLTSNTQYFYRAWSIDGSVTYSSGVSDNATTAVNPDLFISEVANPEDPGTPPDDAKFIELFNGGNSTINFSTDTWYVSRQANGDPLSWADVLLTGSIDAGETYGCGYNNSAFQSSVWICSNQFE